MKRAIGFLRAYKLFGFAVAGMAAAGILEAAKQHLAAHWVLGAVAGIAVIPSIVRMWQDVRNGSYGIDILAVTAIIMSVILQQYWAAIVIVAMLSGSEVLEAFAGTRARRELRDLLKREPQTVHLMQKRKVVDAAASSVVANDTIIVKPGEIVPVDAVITEGTGDFDAAGLTGESLPITKQPGDQILSGWLGIDGTVTAKALRPAQDSQYQRLIRLVRSAAEHPAPFVRLADRYSIPFIVTAYTIAGTAWILSHQAIRFLEVIVVATPCPLVLATPIALVAGMSRASRRGIIIKTGTVLERLAEAKTFAFGKTGILTCGTPETDAVTAFPPFAQAEVLAYAASLEQSSGHVLAKAVTKTAADRKLKLFKAKHVKEIPGFGLSAHVGGKDILVGRLGLLRERQVEIPAGFRPENIAQTVAFLAIDGRLAGYITFTDGLRQDAQATIGQLRRLGVRHTLMLTGDSRTVAEAVAGQLGLTDIYAEASPGGKLRTIEALTPQPVVFVGDGVNDAPVLTMADIGIALGAGGNIAAGESADVVIVRDSLASVGQAVAIARRSFRIAIQSILAGVGLSIVLMLIFATGKFPPLYGAIIQGLVVILVIFSALRAQGDSRRTTT